MTGNLKRNDVPGALLLVRRYLEASKPVPPDLAEVLYRLQNDPKLLKMAWRKLREQLGQLPSQ